jgi:translation initiation factor 5A
MSVETTPTPIKELKPGNYVMDEDEPCKINDIVISKPGKHGSTKARVECTGLFDGRNRSIMKPAADTLLVPIINKRRCQVLSVNGKMAQVMDMEDFSTFDVIIPADLKVSAEPGKEVNYWKLGDKVLLRD